MSRKTVLIIKHGFSETCDHHVSPVISYGDVFRCTCLLEDLKGCNVTWVSARAAGDLLMQNHLIDKLVLADSPDLLAPGEIGPHYDTIINLEKQKDWCQFVSTLSAGQYYGFKDWAATGDECFYPESAAALSAALDRNGFEPLQETLFQTVGSEWTGQRYVLGYQPLVTPIYDVGLNHHIGPKWPTKAWPKHLWQQLHDQLADHHSVSWQRSLNSVRHYIDWLASCRLIVTCDSLGMHLSLGLPRTKIVALFGPTPPEQVYLYGRGLKLTQACDRACQPCFRSRCACEHSCMEDITVDMVIEAVDTLMETQSVRPPDHSLAAPALVPAGT